jgi:DNA-directed RNA polymerase
MIIDYFNKLEEKKIETSDESIIDFTYKKIIKKQIDTTYKNKRFTTTINKISEKIDKEKFIISIRANYVHSQDASLVREVIKRCKIIAIHDCFMIDYLSISKLIKIINKCMNINFHSIGVNIDKKIFSVFIVI